MPPYKNLAYLRIISLHAKNNFSTRSSVTTFTQTEEMAQLNDASYHDNDTFDSTFMYVLPRFCLTLAYIIKPPNVKKQFCRRRRRCVRAYKLSQRRIKRNY